MSNLDHKPVIGKQTGITIGLAVGIFFTLAVAARELGRWETNDTNWKATIENRQYEILKQQAENSARLQTIETNGVQYRWTSKDQLRYSERLQKANPDMNVPVPFTR